MRCYLENTMKHFQQRFWRLPAGMQRHATIDFMIRVFPSLRRSEMQFNGTGRIVADLADSNVKQLFRSGSFEPEFFEIASPLIPRGGVFFDVGANFGCCSFGLCGHRPEDQIRFFLFEANSAVAACLEQSRALNAAGNFQIIQGCTLDQPGFSAIEFDPHRTGGGHYTGPVQSGIPNVVLDQFIADRRISNIDLLKMDIEGAEPLALNGARASLSSGIVKALYIEISTENLARQGRRPNDCIHQLRETGFSLFWCKPPDFEDRAELKTRAVAIKSNHGSFVVAPLENFPEGHQTDILALHNSTPLLKKLEDCYAGTIGSRPRTSEISI
jgi:FkbM family methyltransferase